VEVATSATQQPGSLDLAFATPGEYLYLASSADANALASYTLQGWPI